MKMSAISGFHGVALPTINCLQTELELYYNNYESVGFYGGRKNWDKKRRDENQKTEPTYGIKTGNQTEVTIIVGGKCSHHCDIPCSCEFIFSWQQNFDSSFLLTFL